MSSKKRKQERKQSVNSSPFKPNKVKPKTRNQRDLLQSIFQNDLTFGVGPAGTGKTHIAVGAAVSMLQSRRIEKIIISRPVIEAGQRENRNKSAIGYLPGDINAKLAPFLRPIHDELNKFITADAIQMLKNNGTLEICPLEHMRGRTFERAFIICDEAQNATEEQIEMLLTRLGKDSVMVVVGDIEQSDLADHLEGGFENFLDDLDELEGLGIIDLEAVDIQRHPLVRAILERRREIKDLLSRPVSFERVKYDGQSTTDSSKNPSTERQHDANSGNSVDGCIQENLQGNDLP